MFPLPSLRPATLLFYLSLGAGAFAQNQAPTSVAFASSPVTLAPGAPAGTAVAQLTSVDADAGDAHSYALVSDPVVLAAGSVWKFLDDGSDPGAAWVTPAFDDAAWATGAAQLGYGESDQATTVSFGPDANNKHITTYFRATFGVPTASLVTDLTAQVLRDDGIVVYINGVEVARDNLPAGAITASTQAVAAVGGADENTFFSFPIDLNTIALVDGDNTIAVEVHQSSGTSSDLSFDLRLVSDSIAENFDNASFQISGDQLSTAAEITAAEGETLTVRVRSTDLAGASVTGDLTLTVTENSPPSIADQAFVVEENSPDGTAIGTVIAGDADAGDNLSFAIVGGNTGDSFAIDAGSGELSVADPALLDFESAAPFLLEVEVRDDAATSFSASATITVNLSDANEPPALGAATFFLDAGAADATPLGVLGFSDPDAGDTQAFAITSGNTGNAFAIDAAGTVSVANAAALDPATLPKFDLVVTLTDSGLLQATAGVEVFLTETIVPRGSAFRYLVPSDGSADATWTGPGFDDSGWSLGDAGFGYDTAGDYAPLITTDLQAAMAGSSANLYLRRTINIADPAQIGLLQLRLRFEDGFIAYINGTRVAAERAPATPGWDSVAAGNRDEADAVAFTAYDISAFAYLLVPGSNVLAVHALNSGTGSSDLLIDPELVSGRHGSPSSPVPPSIRIIDDTAENQTGARLSAEIQATGGDPPAVTLYFGTSDGGQVSGAWDTAVPLGTFGFGRFDYLLTGLADEERYYYTFAATNSAGTTWSDPSNAFSTPAAASTETLVLAGGAAATVKVPSDASEDGSWTAPGFDDSLWSSGGTTGVGYDRNVTYLPLIGTDVGAQMDTINGSVYARIGFDLADPGSIDRLRLRMKFDDGYIAYVNGVEVARRNAPALPAWDSFATANHNDTDAQQFEEVNITAAAALVAGANLLAIHGLNDSLTSSDMLILPELATALLDPESDPALPALTAGLATAITPNSATVGGALDSDGGAPASATLVYGTSDGGSDASQWQHSVDLGTIVPGAGSLDSALTGLTPNTSYFFRFYAWNPKGFSWAAASSNFTTTGIAAAQIITVAADAITTTGATLQAELLDDGGDSGTQVIFAWGPSDQGALPASWANQLNIGVRPPGTASHGVSGFPANETVFFRAFSANGGGVNSQNTLSFTTSVASPALRIAPATLAAGDATLAGELLSNGGEDPQVVIHWGTTDGGTDAAAWDTAIDLGVRSPGSFSALLGGIGDGVHYYWRAAATNSAGSSWAGFTEGFKHIAGTPLVSPGTAARYLVPADASDESSWFGTGFDASGWPLGTTGFGYDTSTSSQNYHHLIATDIGPLLSGVNASAYLRIPFEVTDPTAFGGLLLRIKYDDGFVAYLNGIEVASANRPALLSFNAAAAGNHADPQAVIFTEFDLGAASLGGLVAGDNLLAIHGLNSAAVNSDFLIIPELIGTPPLTFATWIAGFPGLSGDAALPEADPDCDGLTNAAEYAFGGDPTRNELASSGVRVGPTIAATDVLGTQFLEITYRRRLDYQARNITYAPQSSLDLADWPDGGFTQIGPPAPTGDGLTELVILRADSAIGAGQLFGRVEITAP